MDVPNSVIGKLLHKYFVGKNVLDSLKSGDCGTLPYTRALIYSQMLEDMPEALTVREGLESAGRLRELCYRYKDVTWPEADAIRHLIHSLEDSIYEGMNEKAVSDSLYIERILHDASGKNAALRKEISAMVAPDVSVPLFHEVGNIRNFMVMNRIMEHNETPV